MKTITYVCIEPGCTNPSKEGVAFCESHLGERVHRHAVEVMLGDVARAKAAEVAGTAVKDATKKPAPEFRKIADAIGALVTAKNAAYGDSHAKTDKFLAILYPDGIKPEQYADALTIVRVFDKLMRIATDRDALGESPWMDIAGYGILAVERLKRDK